jgi:WD40 domain-containing protein/carboxypeptidase family protein/uncharacterized protein DUF4214
MRGHTHWISAIEFSPDGQMLASGSGDTSVKLWNTADGTLIRTVSGTGYPVTGVTFSPDGQTLAVSFSLGNVQLRRVSDGTLIRTIDGAQAYGTTMNHPTFSRDGTVLIASSHSYPPVVWFWRVSDGSLLQTQTVETGWVQPPSLAVSPDGTQLAIGRYDAIVEAAQFPALAPTAAPAGISGQINTADGSPVGGVVIRLNGAASRTTFTDSRGRYHFDDLNTDNFYTVTPSLAGYHFAPASQSFSLMGHKPDAGFIAGPDVVVAGNAIDTTEYFVRQQYLDLLDREPDQGGFEYWSERINECNDAACISARRIDVAAAFFVEQEFQRTGSFIYNVYKSSLGRRPGFAEYSVDRQQVIGGPDLDMKRTTFAENFVQRAEFTRKYQGQTTAESFVDAVLEQVWESSKVDLAAERGAWLAIYQTGSDMNQSRARVLQHVIEAPAFKEAEYNAAFVLTEYFGYLRRDPEPEGYAFWLNVLNNREPGNFRGMVCSFITSTEYQRRFSSVVSRNNAECGH